jgi:putative transposase
MTTTTTPSSPAPVTSLETAWQDVDSFIERFCLTAGIGAIEQMLCEDAQQLTGAPHNRSGGRVGHRWGRTKGKIGFHGGKLLCIAHGCAVTTAMKLSGRPGGRHRRKTGLAGHEPDADQRVDAQAQACGAAARGRSASHSGDGTSKSAPRAGIVALSAERLAEWMTSELFKHRNSVAHGKPPQFVIFGSCRRFGNP